MANRANSKDVYTIVTNQILEQLRAGTAPWRRPWSTEPARNLNSQREYRGINQFILSGQGYACPNWLTFEQCQRMGGHVNAGSKGSMVVFWKQSTYTKHNEETEEDETRHSVLLRYYHVFNVEQTNLGEKLGLGTVARVPRIDACEAIVAGMPNRPEIIQSADRACYSPSLDAVAMPAREKFAGSAEYYSVLFHELTHSTGHKSRLGRIESWENFGSNPYAKEELVAEMGASMLCGVCGIEPATLENSAAYLANWLRVLENDTHMVVNAAAQAQRAADYIRAVKHENSQTEAN